ncbi:CpsD/CapB family tyrosine-protein kinase [Cognatishimia sp. F0-27]|nr:CpsD/CapB family tyrosine-protein kinase [Cognatishimia sp. F0-27]
MSEIRRFKRRYISVSQTTTQKAEEAERQRAEEAARQRAEEVERKRAEEAARQRAGEVERQRAEEAARQRAEEAERQRAEEAARQRAEEAARQRAEEAERQRAEEAERQRAEEAARQRAEEAARQRAEEVERQRAEEAERKRAEEVERQRAEEAERQRAEEAERQRAEEAARQRAEEVERQRAEEAERQRAEEAERQRVPLALTNPILPTNPVAQRKATTDPDAAWEMLPTFSVDLKHLEKNKIITASRDDPAHTAFDVLRTRLLQALKDNGWRRVAITSPSKDCGKTFTAANLAISLSRQENCRTLLLDCDMRRPNLHRLMGVRAPSPMGDLLRGTVSPQDQLLRLGKNSFHAGHNIGFGFNSVVEPYASELLQDPRTTTSLDRIEKLYEPDVVLFDLPPALYYDDVIAFRPNFDGVLLVIGGGITTEKEVREVERRLGKSTPLLGTVLNKAEQTQLRRYSY